MSDIEVWDIAKKIIEMNDETRSEIFDIDNIVEIFRAYSPQLAKNCINAFLNCKFKVGEVVKFSGPTNDTFFCGVITKINYNDNTAFVLMSNGVTQCRSLDTANKTRKYFNIQNILDSLNAIEDKANEKM